MSNRRRLSLQNHFMQSAINLIAGEDSGIHPAQFNDWDDVCTLSDEQMMALDVVKALARMFVKAKPSSWELDLLHRWHEELRLDGKANKGRRIYRAVALVEECVELVAQRQSVPLKKQVVLRLILGLEGFGLAVHDRWAHRRLACLALLIRCQHGKLAPQGVLARLVRDIEPYNGDFIPRRALVATNIANARLRELDRRKKNESALERLTASLGKAAKRGRTLGQARR